MKRLLQIGFDILLMSGFPILTWILLGNIIDKSIANVFSIIYPIQSIGVILKCIFGTGANIMTYKEGVEQRNSGLLMGTLIGSILCLLLVCNIDIYLQFMNIVPTDIYYLFTIYGIIQIFLQYIVYLLMEKQYFLNRNKKANTYSISFNIINILLLFGTYFITKDCKLSIIITLIGLGVIVLYWLIQNIEKFEWKIHPIQYFKYDSTTICSTCLFLLTYLFGFRNAFQYGEQYMVAIAFFNLITDTQWDISYGIDTMAKVDICQGKFNYIHSLKNGLKLYSILNLSTIIMALCMYPYYKPNLAILLIFLIPNMIDFFIVAFYTLKKDYLQIEHSAFKTTTITQTSNVMRTLCSFLPTPFCTMIGQEITIYFQFFAFYFYFKKNYHIEQKQYVVKNVRTT